MKSAPLLVGKRALITGASSGLGSHFAKVLAGEGAEVILAARRANKLDAVVQEIVHFGGKAKPLTLDVLDPVAVAAAVTESGPVDIVVNNAGVVVAKPALEQTVADWDIVLNTNLRGAWLVASEVARSMKANNRGGSIINISSILGLRQSGHVAPYAISKAGVIQMTKQLALELARYNIRVNAIAPGYVETDLNQEFIASESGTQVLARIPQRRIAALTDLDGILLLLAGDSASHMTGSVITVDGGHMVSTL